MFENILNLMNKERARASRALFALSRIDVPKTFDDIDQPELRMRVKPKC